MGEKKETMEINKNKNKNVWYNRHRLRLLTDSMTESVCLCGEKEGIKGWKWKKLKFLVKGDKIEVGSEANGKIRWIGPPSLTPLS